MQLKLTWANTKEYLLFDVINIDLTVWFVETSHRLGNRYSLGTQVVDLLQQSFDTEKLIAEEIAYIELVNTCLAKLKMPLFELPTNWFDQRQLNKLHKDWGETRLKWPKLTELLYKIDPQIYTAYQEMNCHIHFIERSWKYQFRDPQNWRQDNPFKNTAYDWEMSHLYLAYPGHGRNAFEKFENLDTYDDIARDNVNWDNIDASIGMQLRRPYKMSPPQEFLEWCSDKKLVPHGLSIALANLTNWQETLPLARQIMTKNVKITDNYFYLEIVN